MSKSHRRPPSRKDYRIAVICALPIESDAVEAMFDEDWEDGPKYAKVENDPNAYTTGRIGEHYVVLAFMPGLGKANAAKLTTAFKINFPEIRLGLVVGICGGTPYIREYPREPREIDVFLGDIIISTEVLQHDLGHLYSNGFVRIDTLQNTLGRPNDEIRAFLHKMRGLKGRARLQDKIRSYLADISQKPGFEKSRYQGIEKDILYKSEYLHKHHKSTDCVCAQHEDKACQKARESTCEDLKCNSEQSVLRTRLRKVEDDAANQANASNKGAKAPSPLVHFGPVASGDSVVKSAIDRDELADKNEVIGFEMEGAGAWDSIPIVVIKSVVDYADSHKSYLWQKYGAACGAACMKAFVNEWSPTEKTLQLGAGPSAQNLPERQTGESSGEPREKSETRSELENPSKHVKDDLDNAYALFQSPCKSRKNLEAALQILSKAEDELIYLDSSTRQRMYWGLMTVEKELSGYGGFETAEKMEHINKAQKYGIEVKKIVLQSSDASLDAQLSLEQHIIEGKKALLDFEVKKDVDKLKRLKSEAEAGIDASLGKLQEVDPKSYDMVIKAAMEWRKKFPS